MDTKIKFSKNLPTIKKIGQLLIAEAICRAGGNAKSAAKMLDIPPESLEKILNHYERKIKNGVVGIIIFFSLILTAPYVNAEEDGTVFEILSAATGIITSYAIHETGHLAVAKLTDTELDFEAGTYNQPIGFTERVNTDDKGVALNASGLIIQIVGSEVIINSHLDKNNNFVRGMMLWNILNPISYSLDYWFFNNTNKKIGNNYQGDIQGIEHYSNKSTADWFAVSMVAVSLFQGYRFLQTQDWSQLPKQKESKTHLDIAPTSDGKGVVFKAKYKF